MKKIIKRCIKFGVIFFSLIGFLFSLSVAYFLLSLEYLIPFTPCGPGFGSGHHTSRINMISEEFEGGISGELEFLRFECSGFQDFVLNAEILSDQRGVESFIDGIENAYFQNDLEQKKKKQYLFNDLSYVYRAEVGYLSGANERLKKGSFDLISITIKSREDRKFFINYQGVNL